MMRILYLVHNLNDPAVERRVRMLRAGGASVTIAGFWRGRSAPSRIADAACVPLGRTRDAKLMQRAALIARRAAVAGALRTAAGSADILLARNLEMLVLAARIRRRRQRLVYECLDIHRKMIGGGLVSAGLRALERRLLRSSSLLVTSSPAFIREYFLPRQKLQTPSILVENKRLELAGDALLTTARPDIGPPWTIGWFGNLRCRRSLEQLTRLAGALKGKVRILIAGRASEAEFPEFHKLIAKQHVAFIGPYGPDDLPSLYAQCHFAWCVDYFEEGLNSEWLLPNRLYEAISCGAVPIARAETETARWLVDRGVGVILPRERAAEELCRTIEALTRAELESLSAAVGAVPAGAVTAGEADCRALVQALAR